MMAMDRRQFLKVAGVGAMGLAGLPASRILAGTDPRFLAPAEGLQADRWAMVIDLTMKASDETSIMECHKIHNVPHHKNKNHEIKWIWNTPFTHAFPELASDHMVAEYKAGKNGNGHGEAEPSRVGRQALVLCNHCENPPCVRACPTKATFKRKDGIVLMDFHRCIGCRFCMAACPFGARSFNFVDPRPAIAETNLLFPTRMKGVVEKCNFCAERLARGEKPKCVEEAEPGRMLFGAIDSPEIRDVIIA
jgi:molybdopterin-containing oxidoreductase family iron-sulfur binding subunit